MISQLNPGIIVDGIELYEHVVCDFVGLSMFAFFWAQPQILRKVSIGAAEINSGFQLMDSNNNDLGN
jgi:hypothetical protein